MKNSIRHLLSYWLLIIFTVAGVSCQKEINSKSTMSEPSQVAISNSAKAERASAQVVIDWYKLQLRIILNANPAYSPLRTGRIFAYEGIGLYESVRHGIVGSVGLSELLYQMPAMPQKENNNGYSWEIAANAALASMIRSFYPNLTVQNKASIDSLEKVYNDQLSPDSNSQMFRRSQAYGQAIAEAVFNWSKTDGDNQSNTGYVLPVFQGSWIPTPPAFAGAFCPYLGTSNRPFLQIHTSGSGAPAFSIPYSTVPGSAFHTMAKDLYDVSQTLTEDQRNIAVFWNDVGVGRGYTPHGHSISIAVQVLEREQSSLATAAIAFAKMGIASWDAGILCFRAKYNNNLVRPVTYIQQYISPGWLPLIPTPAHPEYPAAHAYITRAEMEALSSVIGFNYAFTDHTYNFLGYPSRSYSSLNAAGDESGFSRRYGGIHYLPSINAGLILGEQVGATVANLKFIE